MTNGFKRFFGVFVAFTLGGVGSASAIPSGDYNGGGYSDLAYAQVTRGRVVNGNASGSTRWVVRETETGIFTEALFNVPGDALVPGRWFGGSRTYPGLVFVRNAKLPLEWHIKSPDGGTVVFAHGRPGATIPPPCDYDGDGKFDAAVVYNDTRVGLHRWEILSTGFATVITDYFGQNSDRVLCADTDGDGVGEMIALRDGFFWFAKKLSASAFTTVQWGLRGDFVASAPVDVDKNGVPDYVISRATGNGQQFFVRYGPGSSQTFPGGNDDSIPFVMDGPGVGLAWVQRNTGFAAFLSNGAPNVFPFTVPGAILIAPDGRVIQPNDSGKFGTAPTGGGGGGGGSFADVTCTETFNDFGGRGGNTYRPYAGKGTKLIIDDDFTGEFYNSASEFRIYTTDGSLLGTSRAYGSLESGGRVRSYLNPSARNLPDRVTIVAIAGQTDYNGVRPTLCFINIDAKRSQN